MESADSAYQTLLDQFLHLASGGAPEWEQARETTIHPPEALVQAIWRGQFLQGDRLTLENGGRVEVLDPGRFQTGGAGPDFRNSQLIIRGQAVTGDVEIHRDAADWRRHRHDQDFEYNGVVLHVALHASDSDSADHLQNGGQIPRLLLMDKMEPDHAGALALARELILSEQSGTEPIPAPHGQGCRLAISQLGAQAVRTLLARASDVRLARKVQRLRTQCRGLPSHQILHEAILRGLGQQTAKTLYFLLSRRVPMQELMLAVQDVAPAEQCVAVEAILLGVAGLLPADQYAGADWDENAQTHAASIRSWWAQYRGRFSDRVLPVTRSWFGQVRPPAFPCRRLAAYSTLLTRTPNAGFLGEFVLAQARQLANTKPKTAKEWKTVASKFGLWMVVREHPYWANHCTWGGKALPRSVALLGEDQADALALNALLPWCLFRAEDLGDGDLGQFLRDLYGQFPSLPANSVTRYMESRLFDGKAPPEIPLKLERYRQGLIQMFADCCDHPSFGGCGLNC